MLAYYMMSWHFVFKTFMLVFHNIIIFLLLSRSDWHSRITLTIAKASHLSNTMRNSIVG